MTLYQLGWRLGGKGASGRGVRGRIEEHGLHIWMGFYENSFRAIRQVFEEVQPIYRRITDYEQNPFKSWRDAFKPHNYIVLAENIQNQWKTWGLEFPANNELPGEGDGMLLSSRDYLVMLVKFLCKHHCNSILLDIESLLIKLRKERFKIWRVLGKLPCVLGRVFKFISYDVAKTLWKLFDSVHNNHRLDLSLIEEIVQKYRKWLHVVIAEVGESSDELRRLLTVLELVAVTLYGLIKDDVLNKGLDSIDVYDFRQWLRRHGALEFAVLSAPVQSIYDLVFGYENGELKKANFAAGVAVRSIVRIALTYKGAVFWKMQAGMGDTVFAPPYLVLKERGVKFKFFHKVEQLHLSEDKKFIDTIKVGVQATLKAGQEEYEPLVNVKNLPCWPAWPRYEQLEQGETLKERNINLESFYSDWENPASITLKKGEDFDHVVLGISIGALPYLCQELAEANLAFKNMLNNIGTVRTQAMQLWLDQDLQALGWDQPSPVMDAYVEPLNTWSDMSQLIDKEDWPEGSVKNIAYFCGPMVGQVEPATDHVEPMRAMTRVWQASLTHVQTAMEYLWPNIKPKNNTYGIDFQHFVSSGDQRTDMEKFNAQFFKANIDPSERYVLSLKGTTAYRLRANESGFHNLTLTGDWIRNGFNAGCIEATTMSGMQAAYAVSGYPVLDSIIGFEKS